MKTIRDVTSFTGFIFAMLAGIFMINAILFAVRAAMFENFRDGVTANAAGWLCGAFVYLALASAIRGNELAKLPVATEPEI